MINKLYVNFKKIIKQNLFIIILLILTFLLFFIKLPFYVDTGGGIINLDEKVKIKSSYNQEGSINLTYVSELDGNLIFVLLSYVLPNWDLVSTDESVASNETISESEFRNKMLLNEANSYALINAFNYAKKEYNIESRELYVTYVDENSNTNLKVGDKILSVDGINDLDKDSLKNYINSKDTDDTIKFEVINNNKKVTKTAKVLSSDGKKIVGIMLTENILLKTNPNVTFNFSKSESGSSAGLMTSLQIYNKITKEDITNGKIISGTGTIDTQGNVGSVAGIEYKLKAANKYASIFFVPNGENYKEAIELKKKNKYNIKVVGVSTFSDVIFYLKNS